MAIYENFPGGKEIGINSCTEVSKLVTVTEELCRPKVSQLKKKKKVVIAKNLKNAVPDRQNLRKKEQGLNSKALICYLCISTGQQLGRSLTLSPRFVKAGARECEQILVLVMKGKHNDATDRQGQHHRRIL